VQRHYRAKAVVLATWKKGAEPRFFLLDRVCANHDLAWRETSAAQLFGKTPVAKARRSQAGESARDVGRTRHTARGSNAGVPGVVERFCRIS
jgi:hypothetical protein